MVKSSQPPAKKRYDETHPVISFRASKEEYEQLKDVLGKQKKSIGVFFREALGIEQRNYDEARKRGFEQGFKAAKNKYAVSKNCIVCGEPIVITDPMAKKQMAVTYRACLRHEDCEIPYDPNVYYPFPIVVVPKRKKG